MTDSKTPYELATELQSLTFDMCMLESTRGSAFDLHHTIECNLQDGVYADESTIRRMEAVVKALKALEDKCEEANLVMSKRDQEIVWELSGRTSEIPGISECPFCGGEAKLTDWTEAYYSRAYVFVGCTRCEDVSGPQSMAVEFHGMCNPWRNPTCFTGGNDTVKGAKIEAVTRWNRRMYGGKAIPVDQVCTNSECRDWAVDGMLLKPCPICGGDPKMYIDEGYFEDVWDAQVFCKECGLTGPRMYGLADGDEGHPTLEQVRKFHPDIAILGSRKAAYLASIGAWNHRAHGREVSE